MAAGLGALDNQSVGQIVVVRLPFFAYHAGGAGRGDDRNELRRAILPQIRREIERQPRPGKDDIGLFGDRRANHVREVAQRHHDVDAHDAARFGSRLAQLLAEPHHAVGQIVFGETGIQKPDAGTGNDSNAALVGYGRGQTRQRYADPHTALDNRQFYGKIPDFERFH